MNEVESVTFQIVRFYPFVTWWDTIGYLFLVFFLRSLKGGVFDWTIVWMLFDLQPWFLFLFFHFFSFGNFFCFTKN